MAGVAGGGARPEPGLCFHHLEPPGHLNPSHDSRVPYEQGGGRGGWETEARRPPATSPGGGGSPVLIFRSHPHVAFDTSYLPSRPQFPHL